MTAPWSETLGNGTERARIDTFVKSRRVGGSVAAAYRAALWAAGLEMRADGTAVGHPPVDVIICSKDFVSAKRLLREVADALEDLGRAGPEFDAEPQATTIKMRNGRTIEAIPCSDKAIRGNTAAVVADEFAFWRRQEDCWAAIKSVTDPNFKYPRGLPGLFVTTAWDSDSLAHRIFTDPAFPFHRHSVTIHEAIAAGFPIDAERAFAELGIPELIGSEYLCEWSLSGASFFPLAKLRDCQEDEPPAGWQESPAYFGIDVGGGKGRDNTAAVQWRSIGADHWMMGLKAFNNLDHVEQCDVIEYWVTHDTTEATPVVIGIDAGIMGGPMITELKHRFSRRRRVKIVGLNMTPSDQERYATTTRRALEHGRIKLYTGSEADGDDSGVRALMLELSMLKVRPGVGGKLAFSTPRDPSKGHCDRAWAAMFGLSRIGGAGSSAAIANGNDGGYRPMPVTRDFDRSPSGLG